MYSKLFALLFCAVATFTGVDGQSIKCPFNLPTNRNLCSSVLVGNGTRFNDLGSPNGRWAFVISNARPRLLQTDSQRKTLTRWISPILAYPCQNPVISLSPVGDIIINCSSRTIGEIRIGGPSLNPVRVTIDNYGIVKFVGRLGYTIVSIRPGGPNPASRWVWTPRLNLIPTQTKTKTKSTTTSTSTTSRVLVTQTPKLFYNTTLRSDCRYLPVPWCCGYAFQQFNIDLVLCGNNLSMYDAVFISAASRWMKIITKDVPDYGSMFGSSSPLGVGSIDPGLEPLVSNLQWVDDLIIAIEILPIDGRHGVLANAGPRIIRRYNQFPSFNYYGAGLPIAGYMRFDVDDFQNLNSDIMESVITHEMGHVLGIGSLWPTFDLVYPRGCRDMAINGTLPTTDPRFVGPSVYGALSDVGYNGTRAPVENTGGLGTACSHWRESTFGTELMTGYVSVSETSLLSRVTAASLEDLGYVINIDSPAIDAFTVPGSSSTSPNSANSRIPFGCVPDSTGVIQV